MTCRVCIPDVTTGAALVGRRVWRWEFDRRFGPIFVRADGEPTKRRPTAAVWAAFDAWLETQS